MLDLGCGLGYSSAVIALLAEAVVAVENVTELATEAQALLVEIGADNVAVIEGDLSAAGSKHGPYDAITVQGGVEVVPAGLADQLKDGGRIVAIFMEGALGACRVGHKSNGDITWRFSFNATAPVLQGFEREHTFVF